MNRHKQLCSDILHDLQAAYSHARQAHAISSNRFVEEQLVQVMAKISVVADRVGIDLTEKDAML
jgi:hypothetical protein